MNSMNARFKNLVGSKRRSSSNNPSPSPSGGNTPTQRPTSLSPQVTNASNTSLPQQQQPQQQQQTNMNPSNPLGRPPSYTYAPPGGGLAPGQAHGRPNSPLPPINTSGQQPGYPPQQQQMAYPPQQQGPPGYPPQQQQQQQYGGAPPPGQYGAPPPAAHPPPQQQYSRPGAVAEVAGEGRSKAQLIVGIDFVSTSSQTLPSR
jgi:hypothetical protein